MTSKWPVGKEGGGRGGEGRGGGRECAQNKKAERCVRLREIKSSRSKCFVACVMCRKSKVKCDEGRPCSRCKRMGKEQECVYNEMELISTQDGDHELEHIIAQYRTRMDALQVERPLDFWIRSLSFENPSQLREHMNSMGWPDRVLARHWEFGFRSKELMNIFVSLPPYLQRVTRQALHAVEMIMADRMEKAARNTVSQTVMGNEIGFQPEMELDRAFYSQQTFGLIKQHLHPSSGKRVHVFASDTTCKLLGVHAEELLARIANRELSLLCTEFDYLRYVMFGTWFFATRPGRPFEILLRVRNFQSDGETGCTMTKLIQLQEFDCLGRVKAIRSIFLPVSQREMGGTKE
eukprot:763731-Hanusia_phi.AAC.7